MEISRFVDFGEQEDVSAMKEQGVREEAKRAEKERRSIRIKNHEQIQN